MTLANSSALSLRRSLLWALTLTIVTFRAIILNTCAIVIQMEKLGIFSRFLTERFIIFLILAIPFMVAALSVNMVTLA